MFDDIDQLDDEQSAYQQGVQDAATDAATKQALANLARENFARGHNAGNACGIMLGVLSVDEETASTSSSSVWSTAQQQKRAALLNEVTRLVAHMGKLAAAAQKQQKEQEPQLESKILVPVDDDNENDGVNENSFRVKLVRAADGVLKLVDSLSATSLLLPDASLEFLRQLVSDNHQDCIASSDEDRASTTVAGGGGGTSTSSVSCGSKALDW